MRLEKDLIKIIYANNLCISDNPYGINRLWPKSYIDLFYNKYFNSIYTKIEYPKILEVNQTNHNNIILWRKFFTNSIIKNYKNEDINNNRTLKYDVIIISNKNNFEGFDSISKLSYLLNGEGIIIFENVGRDWKFIFKLFLVYFIKYDLIIRDYRLHRFILNNCIITLKNSKNKFIVKEKFRSVFTLIKFTISEIIISILMKLIR